MWLMSGRRMPRLVRHPVCLNVRVLRSNPLISLGHDVKGLDGNNINDGVWWMGPI